MDVGSGGIKLELLEVIIDDPARTAAPTEEMVLDAVGAVLRKLLGRRLDASPIR